MQDFKFNSFVEFYEYLPESEQLMVGLLRDIIKQTIPDIKEKLSWNVPFYYRNKTICFIWPGSVPWGKKTKNGVEFGFAKGYLMTPNNYLETGNRKQVHLKTFYTLEEIEKDVEQIISLLKEADKLDK
ncbi:MAG: DUF1801 domain-containing protein [Crocinitomicaceae bacterium]